MVFWGESQFFSVKRLFVSGLLLVSLGVPLVQGHEIQLSDDVVLDTGYRWRWQSVDDDGRGDAIAHTLKTRVSLDAKINNDFDVYGEFDAVLAFNDGNYNSGLFNPGTSLNPDPQGAELNQLFLQYNGVPDWRIRLGRQVVSFDDERHIGRVAFWQNDRTFDALSISYNNFQDLKIEYAWLDTAQRIFGNGAGANLDENDIRFAQSPLRPARFLGEHEHNSHLLNVNYRHDRTLVIGAFAYLLDNKTQHNASSHTFGFNLSGAFKPGKIKYEYDLQWATQTDAGDNPWQYRADFYKVAGLAQYRSHSLEVTLERYGADTQAGFQTPLADNHRFLGWADIFTSYRLTPGLQDHYLTYKGRKGKLRWQVVLHRFRDAGGDIHIGNELDAELAYRYSRKLELKVISANYRARTGLADLAQSQQDLSALYLSVNYNI